GASKARVHGKYHKQEFLIGEAPATKDLYQQIEIVAPTNYSIILYGESGTGKEVIAKTIHRLSHRKDKPFVAMDCGTLSKELAGSELFGHVKGAFTGASADKEGHFELANGGTLFLDEVGNLSVDIQAALLRVIQERKFKRVGGNKGIEEEVIQMLLKYSWPGNLREFRNVVRRAVLLTQGDLISAKTLPWEITNTNPLTATQEPLKEQPTLILKKDIGLKGAASKAEYET